ncbi:putative ubiquitin carboxyl-terminal hydrolase [Podospora australis]|uniref:ubiquitinyl hydrolase 1 n=1 Tax=Podospora australis TaxID=1536484 RepID=A0AAN6X399_9PEZI|nr:putative ubiquitin carboxyl-terminal hydrolase [Podospora australis]
MNADTRRIPGHFETRSQPGLYEWYPSSTSASLKDRINSASVVVTTLLVLGSFAYQTAYRRGRVPPFLQLVWDLLVYIIPARILYKLDGQLSLGPNPTSMSITNLQTHADKSASLRRILRLDRAGDLIRGVGISSFNSLSSAASTFAGDKISGDNPPGLVNFNNSCYQNSILQGLASLQPLPGFLSAALDESRRNSAPAYTVEALRKLIADLGSHSNSGKTLGTPGALQRMSSWQQQDAQEYYSKVMDQIDKELAASTPKPAQGPALEVDWSRDDSSGSQHSDDSGYYSSHSQSKFSHGIRSIRNPVEGLLAQRVACVNCGFCEGLSMIPFNCLTLNLGNSIEHNLYERLDYYTKLELIEGVECSKCTLLDHRERLRTLLDRAPNIPDVINRLAMVEEAIEEEDYDDEAVKIRCRVSKKAWVTSTKTKQACVARPPQSLVLHMNRSVFDEETGFQYKNYAAVQFPMLLDLGPWVVGSAVNERSEDADANLEQWTTNPRVSMVAGGGQPSRISGPIYELRAVVAHMGRHENGHYVCYRKHPKASPDPKPRRPQEDTPPPPKLASEDDIDADYPSPSPTVDESNTEEVGADQGQWWRFSDHQVSKVTEEDVLAQGGVFMLFYDTIEAGMTLNSELSGTGSSASDEKTSSTPSDVTVMASESTPISTVHLSSRLAEAAAVALPVDSDND